MNYQSLSINYIVYQQCLLMDDHELCLYPPPLAYMVQIENCCYHTAAEWIRNMKIWRQEGYLSNKI